MKIQLPNEPMPAQDSMWLYLENEAAPMTIACTCIFDGPIPVNQFRAYIESKLPLIPRYLQRPVFAPMNIAHPMWELDPNFDIKNHVHHAVLKRGTQAELEDLVGSKLSGLMDRTRPLWDMTVMDGLEGGRSAVLVRANHCLVDGVGGLALMSVLFDTERKEPKIDKVSHRFEAAPAHDAPVKLLNTVMNVYGEMSGKALSAQSAVLDLAEATLGNNPVASILQLLRLLPEYAMPVELVTERMPFNKPLSGIRKMAFTEFCLGEMKAVKAKLGGKLNDVALTVMTAAVRRYADVHGENLHKGRLLRYFVPVNRRLPGDTGVGNRVAVLPVNLPLDIEDPLELYDAVVAKTAALKQAHITEIMALMGRVLSATPPALFQAGIGLLGRRLPIPAFNMVLTNIPGPTQPLYLLGREMLTFYPYVPLGPNMGCNVAIESYNGTVFFGIGGDPAVIPDLSRMRDYVDDAFAQLKKRAGIRPLRGKRTKTSAAEEKTKTGPRRRPSKKPAVEVVSTEAAPPVGPAVPVEAGASKSVAQGK